jgi:hypothetical protein
MHERRGREGRGRRRMENVRIVVLKEAKPQDLGLVKKVEKS